jgi:hypothetical protein
MGTQLIRMTSTDSAKSAAGAHDGRGGDEHEGDDAGSGSAVDPVVDRAALHQHIALAQMNGRTSISMSTSPERTTA